MAEVLRAHEVTRAILVHGNDGLDELSLGARSSLHTVTPEGVEVSEIDAGALLGRHHDVSAIRGGDTEENVRVVRRFLDGTPGPVKDVVCANAALALMVAGRATSLEEGYALAAASVDDGYAAAALARLVAVTNA